MGNTPLQLMGSTFGVDITPGLDYMFSKEFGVGLEVTYLAGRLSDIEVNVRNVSLGDNKENLAHFNFNFGLQHYFTREQGSKNIVPV